MGRREGQLLGIEMKGRLQKFGRVLWSIHLGGVVLCVV